MLFFVPPPYSDRWTRLESIQFTGLNFTSYIPFLTEYPYFTLKYPEMVRTIRFPSPCTISHSFFFSFFFSFSFCAFIYFCNLISKGNELSIDEVLQIIDLERKCEQLEGPFAVQVSQGVLSL